MKFLALATMCLAGSALKLTGLGGNVAALAGGAAAPQDQLGRAMPMNATAKPYKSCSPSQGYDARNMSESCVDVDEINFDAWDHTFRTAPASESTPAAAKHKPVLWVHIHKAAGTTICEMAMENREKVVVPMENCNWKPYDVIWPAVGVDYPPPCEVRKDIFHQQGASWGSIEREIHARDFCPQHFTYGIMLRDPIALALSHFNFEHHKGVAAVTDHKIALECAEFGNEACGRVKSDWWVFFDNWVTRKLNGLEAVALPPRGVTQKDMQAAIDRLVQQFEVVTILENSDETARILNKAFGWRMKLQHLNNYRKVIEFTAQEKETMKVLMQWDYKVYDYMKGLPASVRGDSDRRMSFISTQF